MKVLAALALTLPLLAFATEQQASASSPGDTAMASAGTMELSRSDARPAARGPAKWFTGNATVIPLFDPKPGSPAGAALVRFEPGARTAWHKHPLGQRLVVLEGSGWTQVEGGPVNAIHAGDVVWCPPDVRHWHGATRTTAMAHIAIQDPRTAHLSRGWSKFLRNTTEQDRPDARNHTHRYSYCPERVQPGCLQWAHS